MSDSEMEAQEHEAQEREAQDIWGSQGWDSQVLDSQDGNEAKAISDCGEMEVDDEGVF